MSNVVPPHKATILVLDIVSRLVDMQWAAGRINPKQDWQGHSRAWAKVKALRTMLENAGLEDFLDEVEERVKKKENMRMARSCYNKEKSS